MNNPTSTAQLELLRDPAFQQKLEADTKNTLREIGIECPENVAYKVVRQQTDNIYLIIPAKSQLAENDTSSLSDQDIENISAGEYILGVVIFGSIIAIGVGGSLAIAGLAIHDHISDGPNLLYTD